jgi:hypothetical protein
MRLVLRPRDGQAAAQASRTTPARHVPADIPPDFGATEPAQPVVELLAIRQCQRRHTQVARRHPLGDGSALPLDTCFRFQRQL